MEAKKSGRSVSGQPESTLQPIYKMLMGKDSGLIFWTPPYFYEFQEGCSVTLISSMTALELLFFVTPP